MPSGRRNVQFRAGGRAPAKCGAPGVSPAANRTRSVHAGYSGHMETCATRAHRREPWNRGPFKRFASGIRSLNMKSLKVLSVAAAVALVLPMATPSFAQGRGGHGGGGGGHFGGGGGAHFGGGGARMGGGSFGGARFGGGGGNFAAGAMRPSAGLAMRPTAGATFSGGGDRPSQSPVTTGTAAVATGTVAAGVIVVAASGRRRSRCCDRRARLLRLLRRRVLQRSLLRWRRQLL